MFIAAYGRRAEFYIFVKRGYWRSWRVIELYWMNGKHTLEEKVEKFVHYLHCRLRRSMPWIEDVRAQLGGYSRCTTNAYCEQTKFVLQIIGLCSWSIVFMLSYRLGLLASALIGDLFKTFLLGFVITFYGNFDIIKYTHRCFHICHDSPAVTYAE